VDGSGRWVVRVGRWFRKVGGSGGWVVRVGGWFEGVKERWKGRKRVSRDTCFVHSLLSGESRSVEAL
jgi:hypothetical protein